jgi:solute carrier family 25 carnitine/acylcarnitine transporter 20/29
METEYNIFAGLISGTTQSIVGHPLDTMKVWRQHNIPKSRISLFSGLKYPLITGSLLTSIQFTAAAVAIDELNKQNIGTCANTLGGAMAGVTSGILTSPVDKYKIGKQTQTNLSRYGLTSCLLREIPACAIYFGSYPEIKERIDSTFVSGALAGVASWLFTYPMDVIKTQIQSGESTNIRSALNRIKRGEIAISNGLGFCLARAFLINGVGFVVYEKCLSI